MLPAPLGLTSPRDQITGDGGAGPSPVQRGDDEGEVGKVLSLGDVHAGPGETSVLRSARGTTGQGASAAWPCPGRRDP